MAIRILRLFIIFSYLASSAVQPVQAALLTMASATMTPDTANENLQRSVKRAPRDFLLNRPQSGLNSNIEQNLPDFGDASSRTVSSEDERLLAEQITRVLRKDPGYIDDPLFSDYLNDLGRRLSRALQNPSMQVPVKFEIFGMRDSSINAFAMPGGFIGINTGLMALAESESELAAVMGHEMGHVLQKHYARGQEKEGRNIWWTISALALAALASAYDKSGNLSQAAVMGGQALAVDNSLIFSRDAEREADRVGFQALQAGGFDVNAAPLFFERLQRANALNESTQVSYARTHPLTSERIADMQNRSRLLQTKVPPPSLAFYLARTRARVLQSTSSTVQNLQATFEGLSTNPNVMIAVSAEYGKALIAQQLGKFDVAEADLKQARRLLLQSKLSATSDIALDVTEIDLALQRKQIALAIQLAEDANRRYPESTALGIIYTKALMAAGRFTDAQKFAQIKTQKEPRELIWWDLLAQAYAMDGKRAQEHRALAERFIVLASWKEALEQLQIARRSGDADFYVMSEIDARINQVKQLKKEAGDKTE